MDHVLLDGDQAMFLPAFGPATVVVRPGQLQGSGPTTSAGKKLCVDGDEGSVSVAGCLYVAPPYVVPGSGTLEIASLAADHKAGKTTSGGAQVLLVGGQFNARFKVQSPAQQVTPNGPVPDTSTSYSGKGSFVSVNQKFRGS